MSIINILIVIAGDFMGRKPRAKMIEETRDKLLATARKHFGTVGYANTIMDEITGNVGLTRGALYHHYGDKKGLFYAVAQQLDMEMDAELHEISRTRNDPWCAFEQRCHAYLRMAIKPEVQQIMLRDAAAVLDAEQLLVMRTKCIFSIATMLEQLMEMGIIKQAHPQILARLINGALMDASLWIANNDDGEVALKFALDSLDILLRGLKNG